LICRDMIRHVLLSLLAVAGVTAEESVPTPKMDFDAPATDYFPELELS